MFQRKVTEKMEREIRKLWVESSLSQTDIAKKFNLSQRTIAVLAKKFAEGY